MKSSPKPAPWPKAETFILSGGLGAAIAFYNSVEPGLGMAFLEEIEAAITLSGNFSDLWVELGGDVRRCLVRRFPSAVLYSKDSGHLFILAILHTKRKPGYWLNRQNGPRRPICFPPTLPTKGLDLRYGLISCRMVDLGG